MNYMICDGQGTGLADGLSEQAADRLAAELANARGESVWIYGPDDTDDTATEVSPTQPPEDD